MFKINNLDRFLTDGRVCYQREIDLMSSVNEKFNIAPDVNFLVLKLQGDVETICIANRCITNRHGSEITQFHWGYVDLAKYTSSQTPNLSYVSVIDNSEILECIGQFATLKEADECFNASKIQPSVASRYKFGI